MGYFGIYSSLFCWATWLLTKVLFRDINQGTFLKLTMLLSHVPQGNGRFILACAVGLRSWVHYCSPKWGHLHGDPSYSSKPNIGARTIVIEGQSR